MRIERRTVIGAAAWWVGITLGVVGVIAAAGGIVRVGYVVAVTAASVIVWTTVRRLASAVVVTAGPLRPRTDDADRPQRSFDARTTAIEANLRRGLNDVQAFGHRLQPTLRELAVHRLRRAQGIDADLDPDAARLALGADLWQLLDEPRRAPVSLARIADAVDRIERIA